MDMDSVIGQEFHFGVDGEIIGVMKNFHYAPLKRNIEPLVFVLWPERVSYLLMKIDGNNVQASVDAIESVWLEIVPTSPFEIAFMDERIRRMYRTEATMSTFLSIFALIAIVIACLGLIGLAAYTAERRRNEIGIRKVLGASNKGIIFMLCKDFLILVLIANVLAWPFAYVVSERWLQSYSFRVEIGIVIFIIVGIVSLTVALVTVGQQAMRAAWANPVDAIQND